MTFTLQLDEQELCFLVGILFLAETPQGLREKIRALVKEMADAAAKEA